MATEEPAVSAAAKKNLPKLNLSDCGGGELQTVDEAKPVHIQSNMKYVPNLNLASCWGNFEQRNFDRQQKL